MKNSVILLLLLMAITKLSLAQSDIITEVEKIRQTDVEFSLLSKEKGMKEAFLAYVDDNGVLLRPNMMPVVGFDNVKRFLEEGDTEFTLTWKPLFADVGNSLDLGYTYGTYELSFKDDNGIIQTRYGTYVSIWKKH
jgi:ketosteroid isomerase-like protein